MLKIRKYKSYEFRMMPKLSGGPSLEKFTISDGDFLTKKYIGYVYFKGKDKVSPMLIPAEVVNFLHKTRTGYVGNRRGNYLSETTTEPESYFGINNRNEINLDITNFTDKNTPVEYFDVIKYEPFDLSNIETSRLITFDTGELNINECSFLKMNIIGFIEDEPLFDGNNKKRIISLYDGVTEISETIKIYKNDLKLKNPDILFDEEATENFGKRGMYNKF